MLVVWSDDTYVLVKNTRANAPKTPHVKVKGSERRVHTMSTTNATKWFRMDNAAPSAWDSIVPDSQRREAASKQNIAAPINPMRNMSVSSNSTSMRKERTALVTMFCT